VVTIWGWCLVFVLAGQQPIVQFDYKTEADCNTSENCRERAARRCDGESWCVPIPKPEKAVKGKV